MKILQIAPCFVDIYNETGGVANIIRQICLALESNKIETILICTNTELGKTVTEEKTFYYSDYLKIIVIKQNANPLLNSKKQIHNLLSSINNISLAHIHTSFSTITDYSVKYFTRHKIPCVFTPHGKFSPAMIHNKRALKTLYFKLSLKKYLKRVSEIIASSSNELLYLNEFGLKNSSSFIYNGYTSFSENEHPKDVFIHNKPFLLFLGYLDPRKQPDLLIRAFHSSKAKNIYKLVLAGPDLYGYQMELETLAKSLNLIVGENIDFTGRVTGKIKWELLRNARALILPSKGEGWPVVIAEAIGNETPCILSKECNFSEITQLNLGVEVTDHSISAWSAAIDEICFDEITYEKYKSSLEKNRLNFTWYAITNQWIAKYYSIINDAKTK